jgi:hypothetical protein
MPACRQHWLPLSTFATITILFILTSSVDVSAEEGEGSPVAAVARGVVFDPTTYLPALISYDATMRDWGTSQPFFRHGYLERNARFTRTGLSNDQAVSYVVGKNQILKDTLARFGATAVQNLSSRLVEHGLLAKFPEHRKMVKTIGWIQRIGLASLTSYHLSAAHYRQAGLNRANARTLGYR